MSAVVTFGEVMVRLAAPDHMRLLQAMPGTLDVSFAGAEGNVAAGIALLGGRARFISVFPDNPVGDACIAALRAVGIDTSMIIRRSGSRLGVYYVEHGANQRGTGVVYDRAGSAIATHPTDGYYWPSYLEGQDWLHVTGITPALSQRSAESTVDAVKQARHRGLTVSCDLNYRGKLWNWDPEKDKHELARETMSEVLDYVDVVVGNEGDANDVLGIRAGTSDVESGSLDVNRYPDVAKQIADRFPSVRKVAITLRESISASFNRWGGMLYDVVEEKAFFAPIDEKRRYTPYEIRNIVDRVGAGDAFCAALIFALQDSEMQRDLAEALSFAAAAGALCHTIPRDFNFATKEEIRSLAKGSRSGRVKR